MKTSNILVFLFSYLNSIISQTATPSGSLSQTLISKLYCNSRGQKIGDECTCISPWIGIHCEFDSNGILNFFSISFEMLNLFKLNGKKEIIFITI